MTLTPSVIGSLSLTPTPTVNSGAFNVKEHGAKGDNATDDTSVIQACIDAAAVAGGGTVYFPPGTYITGQLSLASKVTLRGFGKAETTIKVRDNLNNHLMNTSVLSLTDVHFRDLTIDGNKANQTSGSVLNFIIYSRSSVQNVRIINAASQGIRFGVCSDCAIVGCEIESSGKAVTSNGTGSAILVTQGSTRIRLIGNRIEAPNDTGILLGGAETDVTIIGNVVRGASFIGIGLGGAGAARVTVGGNVVRSCTDNGIDAGNATDVTITGNAVSSCRAGIAGDGAQRHTVTGNTVTSSTGASNLHGIYYVNASKAINVVGNNVSNCGHHGICFDGVTDGSIVGNIVRNSSVAAAGNDAIRVNNSTGIPITGNRCFDDQTPKTQAYGVHSTGTSDFLTVVGNDTRGNLTGGISLSGAGNVNANNL